MAKRVFRTRILLNTAAKPMQAKRYNLSQVSETEKSRIQRALHKNYEPANPDGVDRSRSPEIIVSPINPLLLRRFRRDMMGLQKS